MSSREKVVVKSAASFSLEKVCAGTGTYRSVLIGCDNAPNFALRRFVMEPNGGMPLHTNTVEHEQYILKGAAEIRIADEIYSVKEGDVVFIPEGVPHSYKADSRLGFEFLCIVPNKTDTVGILDCGC